MDDSMEIPLKIEMKPPYDPAIPLLGIYPEETKIEKDTCIPLFIAALCIVATPWKQPRCPSTDEWIRCGMYIQWSITQPLKKNNKISHLQQHGWTWRLS